MKRVSLFVALLFCLGVAAACSRDAPPPGEYLPVSANQALLSGSGVSGSVTAVIRDVTCSPENPSSYSVYVEWLSSVGSAERGILEYQVVKGNRYVTAADLNQTAASFEMGSDDTAGEEAFEIANKEVDDVGNSVVVRLVVQKKDGSVVMSIPDEYPIYELCGL